MKSKAMCDQGQLETGTHRVKDEQVARGPITWVGLGVLGCLDSTLNLPG